MALMSLIFKLMGASKCPSLSPSSNMDFALSTFSSGSLSAVGINIVMYIVSDFIRFQFIGQFACICEKSHLPRLVYKMKLIFKINKNSIF